MLKFTVLLYAYKVKVEDENHFSYLSTGGFKSMALSPKMNMAWGHAYIATAVITDGIGACDDRTKPWCQKVYNYANAIEKDKPPKILGENFNQRYQGGTDQDGKYRRSTISWQNFRSMHCHVKLLENHGWPTQAR